MFKSGILNKYNDELKNASRALKISLAFNGLLFVIVLFLIMGITRIAIVKKIEISVPPVATPNQKFILGINDASDNTYKVWTNYFLSNIGTYSYKDVEDKFKIFLQFVDADKYHEFAKKLEGIKVHTIKNLISQKFVPQKIEVERIKGGVKIVAKGFITRSVGDKIELENIPYTYIFYLKVRQGNVIVDSVSSGFDKDATGRFLRRIKEHEKNSKYINF